MKIASGGMATVYLARATGASGFVSEVALKLTHEHLRGAGFSNDLVEEAKLAARIRHRNVVSVFDVVDDESGLYLVMEYIEGDTLAGLAKGRPPLPVPMGVRLLVDALAGLHAAHEVRDDDGNLADVVHRDFTPQNILVGIDGVARLADFGIAKAASRAGHTRTGIVKGKIAYMAPEQAHGTKLDRRCDVWAAGIVAWEILAGRRLYTTEDDIATLLKVATERPPLLRTVAPDVPEAVEAAVARALTMDVEQRPATALAFARDLTTACRDTVGLAEAEDVAQWMSVHVGPRVSGRRLLVAEARAQRDHTDASVAAGRISTSTSLETPASRRSSEPSVSVSLSVTGPTGPSRAAVSTVRTAAPPTELLPTVSSEMETRQLTDGVSVVARQTRPPRPRTPLFAAAGAGVVVLVAGAVLVVRASMSSTNAAPVDPQAASTAQSAAVAAMAASAAQTTSAPTAVLLRLHANVAIASVRVNGQPVPVGRPGTSVSLEIVGVAQTSSLAIDAVAVDGRRAEIAVPSGISDATLEFHGPTSPSPVTRPAARPGPTAAPPAATAPAAAPLAPSPY